jgi:hypothetical protein
VTLSAGLCFPAPFGRRHSLLGPSCARCGIEPFFRRSSGLLEWTPDHNGVAAFDISEKRSGRMPPVLRGQGVRSQDVKILESSQGDAPGGLTRYRRATIVSATRGNGASTAVHSRSSVRSSPGPARPDGSGLPWASPLCCRTLRYLALAGVGDRLGHSSGAQPRVAFTHADATSRRG